MGQLPFLLDRRIVVDGGFGRAARDMTERMLEAQQRGMWQEPGAYREALENLLLDIEEDS